MILLKIFEIELLLKFIEVALLLFGSCHYRELAKRKGYIKFPSSFYNLFIARIHPQYFPRTDPLHRLMQATDAP